MFEVDFCDMVATIWFDASAVADADMEGIGLFENGGNLFYSIDALTTISLYDKALLRKFYKSKRNRMIAQRNSIVTAFGPAMVERVGFMSRSNA